MAVVRRDAAKPTVVKSVPVKEINDQNLGNALIEIGGEEDKENEATIFVSSYDVEEDKDIASHQGDQTRHLHGREGAP
jgi:hypothetical protein